MAYNNLPMSYFPYGQQSYLPQQQMAPVQQPIQQAPVQPQIQNGGYVNVQSEQEARDYLVAQGTSVTFINQPEKMMYEKIRGFSSMEAPTFKKYKIIELKDENTADGTEPISNIEYVEKADFEALKKEVEALKGKKADDDE